MSKNLIMMRKETNMQMLYIVMKDHLEAKYNTTTPDAAFTNYKDAVEYRDEANEQNAQWFEYWIADEQVELDASCT